MEIHRHICWLYSSEEEHRAFVAPFIRQGLEGDEKVVYIFDSHSADAILDYLRDDGLQMEQYLARGQLALVKADDVYLQEGSFDPDRIISLIRSEAHRPVEDGLAGLRITAEMTWALNGRQGSDRLREYEAKLDEIVLPLKWLAVCQYDRRRFDTSELIDLLASHESAIFGSDPCSRVDLHLPFGGLATDRITSKPPAAIARGVLEEDTPDREELLLQLESMQQQMQALLGEFTESEKRYWAVEGLIPFGVWVAAAQGGTTHITGSFLEMTGITLEEYSGFGWTRLLPAEDVESTLSTLARHIATGSPWECEQRIRGKDGAYRTVLVQATPIRDEAGLITGWVGINLDISARKEAEAASRENEKRFRTIFEDAAIGISLVDMHGDVLETNSALQEMIGYRAEELRELNFADVTHPDDLPQEMEYHRQMIAGERDHTHIEKRLIRKDGSLIWVRLTASLVRGSDGGPKYVISMVDDITKRKHAEEALKESEALFRAVVDQSAVGIAIVSLDGDTIRTNSALQQMLGYNSDELAGKALRLITHPDDLAEESELRRQMVAGGSDHFALEKRYFRKDGKVVWGRLTVSLVRSAGNEPRFLIGMVEDITDLRKADENQRFLSTATDALAASLDLDTQLQSVVNLAVPYLADCCAIDMAEGNAFRVVATRCADEAQCETLRMASRHLSLRQELPGSIWGSLAGGHSIRAKEIRGSAWETVSTDPKTVQLLQSLQIKSAMAIPLAAHGHVFGAIYFLTTGSRRFSREDQTFAEELCRRAALAIDNARLYAAEREARDEAEAATKARDEFLSMASHELRTPLTSLRGFAHLAARRFQKEGLANPEQVRHAFEVIDEQSVRMTWLISQLLDVSRIEAGRIELDRKPTDIAALAKGVIGRIQLAAGQHKLSLDSPPQLLALADPMRIEQVLTNLLDNAVKYSPRGGPIETHIWSTDDKIIKISVRDYGIGIPVKQREGLFSRFYQAHKRGQFGGMGLGLFISREIITMHGGRIDVDFPEDGGTCFVISLPNCFEGPDAPPDAAG